jgi:hypothetical protein
MLYYNKGDDAMDVTVFTQLVGSLGFPIVACIVLFKQTTKQAERHKVEMDKMSEAINNNTQIMREVLAEFKARSDAK